jgi:hypothetical protein
VNDGMCKKSERSVVSSTYASMDVILSGAEGWEGFRAVRERTKPAWIREGSA